MHINIKRIYEPPGESDGIRILVDRVWPRGVKKADAHIHLWLKEIAPTTELRKWFNHDIKKWEAFRKRYLTELQHNAEQVTLLKTEMKKGTVTLVYSARDESHNQAVVIQKHLSGKKL